jgi:hypothetical protein
MAERLARSCSCQNRNLLLGVRGQRRTAVDIRNPAHGGADTDDFDMIGRCSGSANRSIVIGQLSHSHGHRGIVDPIGQAAEAGWTQNTANRMSKPVMDQPPQLDIQIVRECPH